MYASDQAQAQVVLGKKIRDIFEIVDIDRRGGRGGRQDKRSREREGRPGLKRSKKRLTKPTREAQVQDGTSSGLIWQFYNGKRASAFVFS